MGIQIYQKDEFKIYKTSKGCIIHNSKYSFEDKHTHMNSVKAAIDLINFVMNKKLPRRTSIRYLESMCRISDDEIFKSKIQQFVEVKINKNKNKCQKRNLKYLSRGKGKKKRLATVI